MMNFPKIIVSCIICFLLSCCVRSLRAQTIPVEEFESRREKIMQRLPDGLLLLHARSFLAHEDHLLAHGFQQNPSFYYFTGLASTLNAILVLDAPAQESWLFIPKEIRGLAGSVPLVTLQLSPATAARLKLTHVVPWQEFESYLNQRLAEIPGLVLYTDDNTWAPTPESNPPGLLPIADSYLLWREALRQQWPEAQIRSAKAAITELRLVKSPAEIAAIRKVARISAAALLAGLRALAPGKSQREVEAAIVCECIYAGGEGPSFWPWVMSGVNAVIPKPFESLADYHHLNRIMQAGELVRVDIGCDAYFYKGDVGRTAPVSGQFSDEQREVWNLFVAAYRGGLAALRDGATKTEIASGAVAAVAERKQTGVATELAKEAAAKILSGHDNVWWHLHGSGLEPGEGQPDTLRAGMVVEFEPMMAVQGQAFYLEDMILITEEGHEILTKGLPYTAVEVERAVGIKTEQEK